MGKIHRRRDLISLATAFADADGAGEEFVIPEDLAALSDADLTALHAQAVENFDALYGDGVDLSSDDMAALAALTEGIEALAAEVSGRDEAAAARAEEAAALAARVRPEGELSAETETDEEEEESEADVPEDDAAPVDEEEGAAETVTASGTPRQATRIPLSSIRARSSSRPAQTQPTNTLAEPGIRDFLVASGEGLGVSIGTGLDWSEAGEALDRRLQTFNQSQYESAQSDGRHIREQGSLVTIRRPIPEELQIRSNDPDHVRSVFEHAADETLLPGGSLVASGGWCPPSTVLYDIVGEVESRDGLLTVPEVGIPRGGISFTTGPDFKDIFAQITGFSFTEAQDIAGEYARGSAPAWAATTAVSLGAFRTIGTGANAFVVKATAAGTTAGTAPTAASLPAIGSTTTDGTVTWERVAYATPNVVGSKPCYKITCPPFQEYRLDVDGLCITAGILQSRGFPEVQGRTIRGALVAHDHRLNGKMIAQMVAGSTAIGMTAGQIGATAPVLTALELQVEHYRYQRRMARSVTLEAVLPFWIRGAVRADLARRLGLAMFDVTDAQINAWFASRGVVPQYVYNWQAIDTIAATAFNQWPAEVKVLLYSAGTWIRGAADIITIDTLYDSVLLGTNDFTALFTEEGWFVAKRGQDSRVITIPITADGATHIGVEIARSGAAT